MPDENETTEPSAEQIERERYIGQLQQRNDKGALYAAGRMLLMLGIPTVLYFFPEWNGNLPTGWKSTGEIIVTGGGILLGSCLVGLYEWDCLQPKAFLLCHTVKTAPHVRVNIRR